MDQLIFFVTPTRHLVPAAKRLVAAAKTFGCISKNFWLQQETLRCYCKFLVEKI